MQINEFYNFVPMYFQQKIVKNTHTIAHFEKPLICIFVILCFYPNNSSKYQPLTLKKKLQLSGNYRLLKNLFYGTLHEKYYYTTSQLFRWN